MGEVINNTEKHRYELHIDGQVAVADYKLLNDRLSITHVGTPENLRGQGIAARVMDGVVADAEAKGLTIIPICPYAASYLKRKKKS